MDYFELECAIQDWAEQKGIFESGTPIKQAFKTVEEVTELCNAIIDNDKEEIKDALGDILVTLIIQASMQNLELEDCLESAYNIIKNRKGKMINGQFMKSE
jgi:NTP pyrophosphatase (non-canonical NTP hydrolase)